MSTLNRAPSIDTSYQVSVHLAEGVSEEKIKMWKVNGRRTPSDGKSSHCLWQGELKKDAAASNKVYQLLACGRWSSPASSTTKTGRHDIADILLKVELKHQKSNQIKSRQVYRGNRRKITEGIIHAVLCKTNSLVFLCVFLNSWEYATSVGPNWLKADPVYMVHSN